MKVIKPPTPLTQIDSHDPIIFIAGSIDMGQAEDWQADFESFFDDQQVTLLNPRRDIWDMNQEQSINNPYFAEQVNWELDGLQRADIIALYFGPTTTSIISMMELGMFADSGKVITYCPKQFWRRGNVEICASRNPVLLTDSIQDWYNKIYERISDIQPD